MPYEETTYNILHDVTINGDLTVTGNITEELTESIFGNLILGDATHAGGDITVYEDNAGKIAFFLDSSTSDLTLGSSSSELGLLTIYGKNATTLRLGDATHEGGNIVVYQDGAGVIQMTLDADAAQGADGLTLYSMINAYGATFGAGDVNIGANKLKTTNLLLKQGDADTFYMRTLADDNYKNLTLSFLRAIGGGRFDGATYFNASMNAGSSDDAYIQINAKDNGVGLVEVARFQGAADPYVQFTLPPRFSPIATASLPATPLEGMQAWDTTDDIFKVYDGAGWSKIWREGKDISITALEFPTDGGAVTLIDMPVVSAADDTEESISLGIDSETFIKLYSLADGAGGIDTESVKFSKDLLIESNLNLFFRDSGLYLYSSADGTLDLSADSSIKLKNGSNVIVTIDSDSMDLSVNASLGSVADKVQLGGKDIAAGRRTFAIATEEPVNADVGLASTHSIIWEIDGSYYKIPLVSYTPP